MGAICCTVDSTQIQSKVDAPQRAEEPHYEMLTRDKLSVQGAGGKGACANGEYHLQGLHNHHPMFYQQNGSCVLFFDEFWKLNIQDDTTSWVYSVPSALGAFPPACKWTSVGYDGNDVDPPPVISGVVPGLEEKTKSASEPEEHHHHHEHEHEHKKPKLTDEEELARLHAANKAREAKMVAKAALPGGREIRHVVQHQTHHDELDSHHLCVKIGNDGDVHHHVIVEDAVTGHIHASSELHGNSKAASSVATHGVLPGAHNDHGHISKDLFLGKDGHCDQFAHGPAEDDGLGRGQAAGHENHHLGHKGRQAAGHHRSSEGSPRAAAEETAQALESEHAALGIAPTHSGQHAKEATTFGHVPVAVARC